MTNLILNDSTLRDGNHAIRHRLTVQQIRAYASAADVADVPIVEVGHGNGIGASSLQVGESLVSDHEMLAVARSCLTRARLGVLCIPGFATINKDLRPALDLGVDVVRVGSHCSESDVTERHIDFVCEQDREAHGVLMMIHMASAGSLAAECVKMQSFGAQGVILMDSAGASLPHEVSEKVATAVRSTDMAIGFHAHNNLGMAVANSVAAARAGATILDGTAKGFGAGAGNTQLEVLVAVLEKLGYSTGIDLYRMLDAAEVVDRQILETVPRVETVDIVSGLAGVFSGFVKHVERIADDYAIDPRDLLFELGRNRIIAGQEDLIYELAQKLALNRGASS